jgi:tRNA dimethylallyltransferase
MRLPLISIIGATGTGKSQVIDHSSPPPSTGIPGAQINSSHRQLAVELALSLNGEVINADAMQLYRGLPIITNKITPEERRGVPHHLLGCLDTTETWQVGRFVKEAECMVSFCSI